MRTIRCVARVRRTSPVALVALALLVALVGGAAMASVAVGRRATGSVERFLEWSRPEDASVIVLEEDLDLAAAELERVAAGPPTFDDQRAVIMPIWVRTVGEAAEAGGAMVIEVPLDDTGDRILRRHLVDGRRLDPGEPDEAEINERLAAKLGLAVGDEVVIDLFSADQVDVIGNGDGSDPVHSRSLTVTGIVRTPRDLERSPYSQPGTLEELNDSLLFPSTALWESLPSHDLAAYGVGSRFHIAGGLPAAEAWVQSMGREDVAVFGQESLNRPAAVQRAVDIEAAASFLLGALVALVGIVLVGSFLRRVAAIDSVDRSTLAALGVSRATVAGAEVVRIGPALLVGAGLAVVTAVAFATLGRFGTAGRADIGGGLVVDGVVLASGFVLILFLGVTGTGLAGLAAARARPGEPRSRLTWSEALSARFGAAGASPGIVTGVRMAVPLPGRRGSAVRTAVAAIAVSVGLLVATVTFAASLRHVIEAPEARGWTWDVEVGNYSEPERVEADSGWLAANPDVDRFTAATTDDVSVRGEVFDLAAVEDPAAAGLVAIDGRLPSTSGEVAFSPDALRDLDLDLDDDIALSMSGSPERTFRVVGTTLGPGAVDPRLDLRRGVLLLLSDAAAMAPDGAISPDRLIVRFRDDVDQEAALARLRTKFPRTTYESALTPDLSSVGRARTVLAAYGAAVAVLATATLLYALANVLARRRREVAVLKALGFARGQIRSVVLIQAVGLTAVAIALGAPLGLVAGRWAWAVAARTIGVTTGPVVPPAVLLVGLAALAVAALSAVGPALRAQRIRAAEVLRTE